jgi:osmotically-inducible protein OsmY
MGIFSRVFGGRSKFNDAQIEAQAMTAVSTDPMISDHGSLVVSSKHGVVTVSGSVQKPQEKERIEGVIRNALTTMSVPHERIVNELRVPNEVSSI